MQSLKFCSPNIDIQMKRHWEPRSSFLKKLGGSKCVCQIGRTEWMSCLDDGSVMERWASSVPFDTEEVAADIPQPPSGFITAALRSDRGWSAVAEKGNELINPYFSDKIHAIA